MHYRHILDVEAKLYNSAIDASLLRTRCNMHTIPNIVLEEEWGGVFIIRSAYVEH